MAVRLIFLAATLLTAIADDPELSGQAAVDYINNKQSLFTADLPKMSFEEFKSRLMKKKYLEYERNYAPNIESDEELPESFDARKQWPQCSSISTIRDQANCGSCWAVSTASAMSDRACVQSKGRVKSMLSDTDLLTCCGTPCGEGCDGGYLLSAIQYMKRSGLCSGGAYLQKGVCRPYSFHPCGKHANQTYYGECRGNEDTPRCRRMCQLNYPKKYENDKIYASSAYDILGETNMMREIMKNGPIASGFLVYTDFFYYSKGIYKHTWGVQQGGHAIKIIGWGVENGVKYWLVANSWNSDWGENGYFRIRRGFNECEIEEMGVGGLMDV